MKIKMLLSIFMAFSTVVVAQYGDTYVIYKYENHMNWGDYHYQKNLDGIGHLMTDVRTEDRELYDRLNPQYQVLRKQQQEAGIVMGVGAGIGAIMMVGGYISSIPDMNSPPTANRTENDSKTGIGIAIVGGLVGVGSMIVGNSRRVDHQDILNFTNQFNQHSRGEKLQLSMRPSFGYGNVASAGLAFQIVF